MRCLHENASSVVLHHFRKHMLCSSLSLYLAEYTYHINIYIYRSIDYVWLCTLYILTYLPQLIRKPYMEDLKSAIFLQNSNDESQTQDSEPHYMFSEKILRQGAKSQIHRLNIVSWSSNHVNATGSCFMGTAWHSTYLRIKPNKSINWAQIWYGVSFRKSVRFTGQCDNYMGNTLVAPKESQRHIESHCKAFWRKRRFISVFICCLNDHLV